jgi:hypothetical protein
VKSCFRAKATVEVARAAAAAHLKVDKERIVLVYDGDELPNSMFITQLHIATNQRLIVEVKDRQACVQLTSNHG